MRQLTMIVTMIVLAMLFCKAQTDRHSHTDLRSETTVAYRVYLKDKLTADTAGSHIRPSLSPRSLRRRAIQHIETDITDLPISSLYIREMASLGCNILTRSKWLNTVVVQADSAIVSLLMRKPYVKEIKKIYTAPDHEWLTRLSPPEEPVIHQSIPDSDYVKSYHRVIHVMGADSLHQQGFKGEDKTIAIIDGGFMNADRVQQMPQTHITAIRDMITGRNEEIYRLQDHGTKVLSILAGTDPYYQKGMAPDANYLLIRTENQHIESLIEEDYWVAGVEWADSVGADIISSSLGYHAFDHDSQNHTRATLNGKQSVCSQAASMLADKGIILVCSAGNDGCSEWQKISVPADATRILTVGAINIDGSHAPFSAIGPTADGRIKPEVVAPGVEIPTVSGQGAYIRADGTSFATPIIAGLTACLWQALPLLTSHEIISCITRSADRHDHPDTRLGYGLPDFQKAWNIGRQILNGQVPLIKNNQQDE